MKVWLEICLRGHPRTSGPRVRPSWHSPSISSVSGRKASQESQNGYANVKGSSLLSTSFPWVAALRVMITSSFSIATIRFISWRE